MTALAQVWNLGRSDPNLGLTLTMAQHLNIRCADADTRSGVVVFCGAPAQTSLLSRHGSHAPLAEAGAGAAPVLQALFAVNHVAEVRSAVSCAGLEGEHPGLTFAWAPEENGEQYGTTISFRRFAPGAMPLLEVTPATRERARSFVARHLPGRAVIALHLKNVPGQQSNADQDAWAAALAGVLSAHPEAGVVVVGSDPTIPRLRSLEGVVVAQDEGDDLGRDLALIAEADAFAGMASGPCQLAVYRTRPYTIFKHPDHHPEAMAAELGGAERYSFALPHQRFLRCRDTRELIEAECLRLLESVERVS